MNTLLPETSNIIYALGWGLIHAVWQGLLIYTLLKLALRFIPDNYATVRYYTAVSALGLLTVQFAVTVLYQYDMAAPVQAAGTAAINARYTSIPAAITISNTTTIENILAWYSEHTGTIVAIYIIGIALLLFRLLFNLFALNNLRTKGIAPAPQQWITILNNSIENLNISKHVSLLLSEKISVPMVMGTLKPVILIPVALINKLTTQEAEAILLHELAHVKRNDYLINIIQMFIETILFYNPFVWLISSVIRKEREHCCDDIVVMKTPDRLPYAKALAALETYRLYPAQPALAATGAKNELLIRIKRIMEMKKNNINYGQLTAVLLAVAVLLASVTFIIPEVNAQDKKDKKKKAPVTTTKIEVIKTEKDDKGTNGKVTSTSSATSSGNGKVVKKTIIISDDEEIRELEGEIEKEALKTAKLAIQTANGALAEIDLSGLLSEVMEDIDWDNIGAEISDSLKNIDWEEIQVDVKEAMKEANKTMKEVHLTTRESSKEIAEAKKQIAEAHKQIAEASKQLAEARRHEAEIRHEEIKKYRKELDNDEDIYIRRTGKKVPVDPSTKILVTSSRDKLLKTLEKDGLIDRRNGYKIVKKGNELYIDGIKQSKEVLNKYDKMMGDENFTIKGNYRSIKISTGD